MSKTLPKRIAVVGGTGHLGSSVALSLSKNPDFDVCVLSRDSAGEKAQAIRKLGINVITANNWNADALGRALQDCWGLFINIDSDNPEENWKSGKQPSEYDMMKIVVDSAVHAGIKHVVHASLPYSSQLTDGRVRLVSFDDKAKGSLYLLEQAKLNKLATATIVNAGWFLENSFDPKYIASFGGFAGRVDEEGFLTWKTPPMGNDPESVPWLAVADDYGDIVHGVFLEPEEWNGKYVDAVSESTGFGGMTEKFQKITGKPSRYIQLTGGKLSAGNATKTTEVNGLFDLMHALGGNFFNGRPTEHEPAKLLKSRGSAAAGKLEPLMTMEQFFQKYACS